jgi:hypothetical protein
LLTRRTFATLLAGLPLLAATRGDARESVILRLIKEAREQGAIAERIAFISHALLGTRYQAHTLIGGPRRKEVFVTRDDAFDCVTYCEVVLAAAIATDFPTYSDTLRRIRYARGEVRWAERNHDFAQWSRRIVENGICRPVAINPITTVDKLLEGGGLGRRQYRIAAVGSSAMLANQEALQTGDVIGFVSRRSDLDNFHTGFIAFERSGRLMLRQASQSRGRVLDEDMRSFVARTGVKYVTLLRAEQRAFA